MTTTRIYKSGDAGAPVIAAGTTGSLLAALRACLVGTAGIAYGAKPAAGWTEIYTGVNEAVFRNSTAAGGTGCGVHVVDQITNGYRGCLIQTYSSASGLGAGSNPTHARHIYRAPGQHATNPTSWCIAADEITFYIGTGQDSASGLVTNVGGAGDIESFGVADAYRYFALGGQGIASSNFTDVLRTGSGVPSFGTTTGTSGFSLGRDYTGIGAAAVHGPVAFAEAAGSSYMGGPSMPPRPALNSADEIVMPFLLAREGVVRGRARGLYVPCAQMGGLTVGQDRPEGHLAGMAVGSVLTALRNGNATGNTISGVWVESALTW